MNGLEENIDHGTGALQIDIQSDMMTKIRSIAKARRIGLKDAVELCFLTGFGRVQASLGSWERNASDRGVHERISSQRAIKYDLLVDLMNLRSSSVSEKHRGYEEFNGVTTALISYLGKRSEAIRLQSLLAERGMTVDIGPGIIPNLDELTSRYLFKVQEKDEGSSRQDDEV